MMQWNANSILQRKYELEHFLKTNRINIAAICETKLSPRRKLTVPGYSIYRQDRNHHGGGVLLLIHKDLQHDSIHLIGTTDMEQVSVILHSPPDKRILIVSGYNPPNRALCDKDLEPIFATNIPAILLGDLNSKHIAWNCESNDKMGKSYWTIVLPNQ